MCCFGFHLLILSSARDLLLQEPDILESKTNFPWLFDWCDTALMFLAILLMFANEPLEVVSPGQIEE